MTFGRVAGTMALCSGYGLLLLAILQGQPFRGYDAYTHLFFASHYLNSWWSTWEPRWYQGFDVVSYPPLAHQLLALLVAAQGKPLADAMEPGYQLALLALAAAFPLAVYRFARAFVGPAAAWAAAAVSLLQPALAMLLIPNGQVPGLLSLELLLLGVAAGAAFLRAPGHRGRLALAAAVVAVAAAAAAHHATPVLAGPFFVLALAWRVLYQRRADTVSGAQGWPGCVGVARRALLLVGGAGLAALAVVWPFWAWWVDRPLQVPIDHLSRHNFWVDAVARFKGLWLPYSLWLLVVPLAMTLVVARRRDLLGLALAALALFVLSLGGTTPLPRWLYGRQWQWLTYERYSLWASVALLPLEGLVLAHVGRRLPVLLRNLGAVAGAALLLGSVANAAWYGTLEFLEPRPIDVQPAVDFLACVDQQHPGRYLTLGFGDQLSKLSALSSAASIDGDYNTARRDPRLTGSGIDKLDSSRYWDPYARTLRTYLADPDSTGLRWVLANERYYDRLLWGLGWQPYSVLSNGVIVWQRPHPDEARALSTPRAASLTPAAIWWGTVPLLAFGLCLVLQARLFAPRLLALPARLARACLPTRRRPSSLTPIPPEAGG